MRTLSSSLSALMLVGFSHAETSVPVAIDSQHAAHLLPAVGEKRSETVGDRSEAQQPCEMRIDGSGLRDPVYPKCIDEFITQVMEAKNAAAVPDTYLIKDHTPASLFD